MFPSTPVGGSGFSKGTKNRSGERVDGTVRTRFFRDMFSRRVLTETERRQVLRAEFSDSSTDSSGSSSEMSVHEEDLGARESAGEGDSEVGVRSQFSGYGWVKAEVLRYVSEFDTAAKVT